jgi:hypothetical protein
MTSGCIAPVIPVSCSGFAKSSDLLDHALLCPSKNSSYVTVTACLFIFAVGFAAALRRITDLASEDMVLQADRRSTLAEDMHQHRYFRGDIARQVTERADARRQFFAGTCMQRNPPCAGLFQ